MLHNDNPVEKGDASFSDIPISNNDVAESALESVTTPAMAELPQRIAQLLGRSVEPIATHRRKVLSEIPAELALEKVTTEHGTLWLRRRDVPSNHQVGRGTVGAARLCDMTTVALLALDPSLAKLDPSRALFLDTETTTLGTAVGNIAFVIGLAFFINHDTLRLEQLMLPHPGQELPMLRYMHSLWEKASMIVSFNGKSFDLPVLRTRNVMCGLSPLPPLAHIDLLHMARRIHKHRLRQCHLGAVESQVLAFNRIHDLPSEEVPKRYFHYLRTGEGAELEAVLIHNEMDVLSMAALLGLYGEPLGGLHTHDLAQASLVATRGRKLFPEQIALNTAEKMASVALDRKGAIEAQRAFAIVCKARNERDRAIEHFERFVDQSSDPHVHLELAKLYEHHVKAFDKAITMVKKGVAEPAERAQWRYRRLQNKLRDRQREVFRK